MFFAVGEKNSAPGEALMKKKQFPLPKRCPPTFLLIESSRTLPFGKNNIVGRLFGGGILFPLPQAPLSAFPPTS
jgi:hypothetical protein